MSKSGTMDHKCPSCGAVLKFNPHGQNWVCEYCKSAFSKDEVDKYEKERGVENLTAQTAKEKIETNFEGADVYLCPNCGAQIIADESTSATFCVYCKNTAILKNKLVGEFNPTKIIPFYKTKDDAIAAFKSICKGRILMPRFFNKEKNIEQIKGVYIPFWLYDYSLEGIVDMEATRITSWVSGNYDYTKTDTFSVMRGGSMNFHMIPVDGSTHFPNDIMNSIEPFDYSKLVDFSHSYLSGFLAEKYDLDANKASEEAISRAKQTATEVFKDDASGYSTVSVKSENHNFTSANNEYVLLPVWLLNVQYHGKLYTFAMNGETGKIIGNIPVDRTRAFILWISSFVGAMLIFSLIWLMVK